MIDAGRTIKNIKTADTRTQDSLSLSGSIKGSRKRNFNAKYQFAEITPNDFYALPEPFTCCPQETGQILCYLWSFFFQLKGCGFSCIIFPYFSAATKIFLLAEVVEW